MPCLSTGGGLYKSLVHSRGSPISYLLRLSVFIISAGPQDFNPV
uniref:Uncharacterized protein n=1 Tax=Trichinella nativa TaxID=6335 RepID=A0A0V1KGZ4_9BILA